ncbi:hypothetical protein TIFTF001_001944 [Ficus carica]|uniref:Uncharacterized protein n=1 Tax=Ficus carica TaxID=3494 RepID=A0AA88CSQ7_FICCA|nr:hypothetical protein TIFTF001_001944 [Ficus carica]
MSLTVLSHILLPAGTSSSPTGCSSRPLPPPPPSLPTRAPPPSPPRALPLTSSSQFSLV